MGAGATTTANPIELEGERLAAEILADPAKLDAVIAAAGPERIAQPAREAAAAALKLVAARRPEVLLPRWHVLLGYLECGNAFTQMATANTLAILAPSVDGERMAAALPGLEAMLGDKVSVSAHTLMVLREIGAAHPALVPSIVAAILDLERVAIANRVENLRGYAIETLDGVLDPADRSPEIVAFVARGLDGDSPRTRKVARDTLIAWGALPSKR